MNPLEKWFDRHTTGPGVWKSRHYFDVYHRHFEKFRFNSPHICEVGVYSGGSLLLWKEYLGPSSHIYGVDIQPACKIHEQPGIQIMTGDQGDREFWRSFRAEVPALDILVDDGSHNANDQIVTLEEMLPHLRPGGVYVCEDIGGVENEFNKYMHWFATRLNEKPDGQFSQGFPATELQTQIWSVTFYPFIMVIEKNAKPVEWFKGSMAGTEWIHTNPGWRP